MTITEEFVNAIAPKHGRTNCSDAISTNCFYTLDEIVVQGVVVERRFKHALRCDRCYLLENIGLDTTQIELAIQISLVPKQPNVKVIAVE